MRFIDYARMSDEDILNLEHAAGRASAREFHARSDDRDGPGDHWVTIDGRHVLIHEPQGRQSAQNQRTRENVAKTAEKYNGSNDWAYSKQKGAFACNTNKCNGFVGDVTKEAEAPVLVTGSDGKQRYPLASELADKNTKIANWRVLGPNEKPQPGDIAAYKLPGGGIFFSGHSGIVTSVDRNGTVHAIAAHETVVGPDNKFNSTPTRTVTYRRYTGDQ
jgi:hypothetical protein